MEKDKPAQKPSHAPAQLCAKHHEPIQYMCLEPRCQKSNLICFECTYKDHACHNTVTYHEEKEEEVPEPVETESQTIQYREGLIEFTPYLENAPSHRLEDEPESLVENVMALVSDETYRPAAMQLVFESYERSVRKVDMEESRKVEEKLASEKSQWLDRSPVLLLGKALESSLEASVSYSEEQTAASQFTMLQLVTKFGDGWGKGLYRY